MVEPPSSPYVPRDMPFWINVFPNPADQRTTIALARHDPIKDATVYDLLGRKMDVPVSRISESSVSLDVSGLSVGAYTVSIHDRYGRGVKQFLVRH